VRERVIKARGGVEEIREQISREPFRESASKKVDASVSPLTPTSLSNSAADPKWVILKVRPVHHTSRILPLRQPTNDFVYSGPDLELCGGVLWHISHAAPSLAILQFSKCGQKMIIVPATVVTACVAGNQNSVKVQRLGWWQPALETEQTCRVSDFI
jgi:hypothetical protein